jgi:hypothetical protein
MTPSSISPISSGSSMRLNKNPPPPHRIVAWPFILFLWINFDFSHGSGIFQTWSRLQTFTLRAQFASEASKLIDALGETVQVDPINRAMEVIFKLFGVWNDVFKVQPKYSTFQLWLNSFRKRQQTGAHNSSPFRLRNPDFAWFANQTHPPSLNNS